VRGSPPQLFQTTLRLRAQKYAFVESSLGVTDPARVRARNSATSGNVTYCIKNYCPLQV